MRMKLFGKCCICIASILMMSTPLQVSAAGLTVHYGSDSYEPKYKTDFKVGVYLESNTAIGDAEVTLQFNPEFMEYASVSPGDASVDGEILTLRDSTGKNSEKYMFNFRSRAGGEQELKVIAINGEPVEDGATAPIIVAAAEDAMLTDLFINGVQCTVNQENLTARVTIPYADSLEYATSTGLTVTRLTDEFGVGENVIKLKAENADGARNFYTLYLTMDEEVVEEVSEENEMEKESEEETVEEPTESVQDIEASLVATGEERGKQIKTIAIFWVVLIALFLLTLIGVRLVEEIKRKKRIRQKEEHKQDEQFVLLYEEEEKDK